MSKAIIKVENISKKYVLKHQQKESYSTFRDLLANKAKSFFKGKGLSSNETEDFWALQDISFEIKQGDRIGIIGRNGAGKSTLLKILSRIVSPTSGRITIEGRVASLLEVGTGFHPELSGRENIFLNGSILGMSKTEIESKFDEIVAFAEVERFLDTPVKRYSSGMYVRLAFAVAAHLEPEILIVDEVLAVGDAEFQKKCLGKMKDISGQGRTVIFVSHNMGAINSLCNSAILLNKGKIQAFGDTETITGLYFSNNNANTGEFEVGKSSSNEEVIIDKVVLKKANGQKSSDFDFGDELEVEIHLNALQEIQLPYIWVSIKSALGPITNASGMIDGFRTSKLNQGNNVISCIFHNIPLLPGQYTVHIGMRDQEGQKALTESKDVAVFTISTSLAEIGLNGVIADSIANESVSPIIPYTWVFNDDQKKTFNVKNYSKK